MGIRLEDLRGENRFFFSGLGVGGTLQKAGDLYLLAYQPLDPLYRPIRRSLGLSVLLAALLAGFAFLASFLFARLLTRDVERLSKAVTHVAQGDFEVEVEPVQTGDELETLASAIRKMVRKLREFYEKILYYEPLAQLGELSAGIAHEIRNPLNGIISCADAIRKLSQHPRIHTLTQEIQQEVHRLNRLVDEILMFARPVAPRPQHLELQNLLESLQSIWMQEQNARKKNLTIQVEVSDGVSAWVDRDHLAQILWNLIQNAIDFSPRNGRITLRVRRENSRIRFEVEDQGPGVPPEKRQLIFQPFYTSKPRGSGLGLSIVRRLVELNKGDIRVEEAPGGGARFIFHLPAQKEESR